MSLMEPFISTEGRPHTSTPGIVTYWKTVTKWINYLGITQLDTLINSGHWQTLYTNLSRAAVPAALGLLTTRFHLLQRFVIITCIARSSAMRDIRDEMFKVATTAKERLLRTIAIQKNAKLSRRIVDNLILTNLIICTLTYHCSRTHSYASSARSLGGQPARQLACATWPNSRNVNSYHLPARVELNSEVTSSEFDTKSEVFTVFHSRVK
jgi:hypothetical protein